MGILRSIRRAMHPVRSIKGDIKRSVKRAVVPKPIRKLEAGAFRVAHPVEAVEGDIFRAADRAITPKRKATKPKPTAQATAVPGMRLKPEEHDLVARKAEAIGRALTDAEKRELVTLYRTVKRTAPKA